MTEGRMQHVHKLLKFTCCWHSGGNDIIETRGTMYLMPPFGLTWATSDLSDLVWLLRFGRDRFSCILM